MREDEEPDQLRKKNFDFANKNYGKYKRNPSSKTKHRMHILFTTGQEDKNKCLILKYKIITK